MKFQKIILYIFLLIGIFSSSHALIADSGIPDLSDTTICSNITDLAIPEQGMIDEARKRGLKKGPNCGEKVTPPTKPPNSHIDGTSWTCNTNYYKSGSICKGVPANAYSSYDSNYWSCNPRHYKNSSRSGCRSVPLNGTKWADDYGFNCNRGYKKNSSGQSCTLNSTGSIPDNAHKDGTSWTCNTNYYKDTDRTCLKVPLHSTSLNDSNDFICNAGYKKKYGNSCVQITKPNCPENSHAVGDECRCDTGYKLNSNRNGCVIIPTTPAPAKTTEDNDSDLAKLIVGVIVAVVLWLIFKLSSSKPTPKSQPRQTPKSQPRPTSSPHPRSTSGSKYKPPIKPKPKPSPKAQPKSKTTNINNPSLLLIEIGVAVAFIDGNLSDEEGVILKEWMTKTLKYDNNISSSKQLFNETFSDAIKAAKAGNLDIQDICRLLNKKGTKELNKEAFRFAYEIMGADGEIHKNEVKMIKLLEKNLQILSEDVTRIRDQFLIKTMIKKDFKIVNLLGLDVSASSRTICRELTKEFSKWNAIINQVKTKRERDNIQKLLDLLGEAREENDC